MTQGKELFFKIAFKEHIAFPRATIEAKPLLSHRDYPLTLRAIDEIAEFEALTTDVDISDN